MMKQKFRVFGKYEGRMINLMENAYSPKQAKLQAAFHSNVTGKDIRKFIKSKEIMSKKE